MVKRDVIQ